MDGRTEGKKKWMDGFMDGKTDGWKSLLIPVGNSQITAAIQKGECVQTKVCTFSVKHNIKHSISFKMSLASE